jgi:cation:H+ antiporter
VTHVLLLLGCAVTIYLACEWFVNAVEWLGARLKLGSLAVGTVLAAVGTALPESVVTLVAVVFVHSKASDDIGVGAALGGPLVVGTIAYAVTGGMLLLARRRTAQAVRSTRSAPEPIPTTVPPSAPATGAGEVAPDEVASDEAAIGSAGIQPVAGEIPSAASTLDRLGLQPADTRRLARDQTWFLAIFVVKVGLGLVAFAFKPWLGLLFFAAYAVYFRREISGDQDQASGEDLAPLKLQPRRASPSTAAVIAQTLATLVVIFLASQLFVSQLEWAGPALGLSPVVVALLLSPVATELPETINAIIWVRQGKTRLALANISGAMMIQATVPSGLGLLATPWHFDTPLILAGVVTLAAVSYLLVIFRTGKVTPARLTYAGLFYLAFVVGLAVTSG